MVDLIHLVKLKQQRWGASYWGFFSVFLLNEVNSVCVPLCLSFFMVGWGQKLVFGC